VSTHVLSIFLVKEGVPLDQLIDVSRTPTLTPIRIGQIESMLYTQSSEPRLPNWTSLFAGTINVTALNLQTASASAVLVVPMKNRTFALSFGYGRYLIDPLAVEPTFGLRATLNSVSTDSIRSIDRKTFEGISTHTQEQASKDTSIGDFGFDVERDLVRAVAGTPTDATLGNRLRGMDALTATCSVTLDNLPELLQAYLAKSEDSSYKTKFPWIDNILEVRDKIRRDQLDAALANALRSGGNEKIWLAVPDLLDWNDVLGFSYSGARSAEIFPDLHLRDYLNRVVAASLSPEKLRQQRIYGHRATNDAYFGVWPVYRCVHAELTANGGTYLLSAGEWYRIDNDFVAVVDESISKIPQATLALPEYGETEDEGDYNKRLAAAINGASCLDRRLIQYGGGKSSIEFCDVYDPAGRIIHVKRYAGSSVLSHLFAQGTVSATAFISSEEFRRAVNKLLPPSARFKGVSKKPNTAELEIAFVIASRSPRPLALPFFSRVTLRNAYIQLSNYGFRTTLTKVQVAPAA
jgi:uncharacterized protein (TIGR04141 family)